MKNITEEVSRILYEVWNPVAIAISGLPLDEYTSYVPKIVEYLQEGCDAPSLDEWLCFLEERRFNVYDNEGRRARAVIALIQLQDASSALNSPFADADIILVPGDTFK